MVDLKTIHDSSLLAYVEKLLAVNLCLSDLQEDTVLDFLMNVWSGYQQMTDTLCDNVLSGRKIIDNPVPIDNIKASYHYFYNAKHNTDIPFFDRFDDVDVLKDALVYRWKEKNTESKLETFDEIAPLV